MTERMYNILIPLYTTYRRRIGLITTILYVLGAILIFADCCLFWGIITTAIYILYHGFITEFDVKDKEIWITEKVRRSYEKIS